ncbi:hypothetical protein V6N13_065634 [Hibiscus sabdariffa]|uniref:Homeobox domain-containing protein n=1 Tax=Hibiscus sabdariffa TaxID=183260 RepID=A0ABR2QQU4_9ROSI
MGNMKVHELARGFREQEPSLSLCCKPLRPTSAADTLSSFDLKAFITPKTKHHNPHSHQVDMQPAGGTRWNPTQQQIRILEMMYRGGTRTPNAQQIEQITAQLSKYGKIEGKNVFYWFQNHKARERQKQKRNSAPMERDDGDSPYKRKCRRRQPFLCMEEESRSSSFKEEETRTLELFPLHPESR